MSKTKDSGSTISSTQIDKYIERLLNNQLLSESEIKDICKLTYEIFSAEKNIVDIRTPITICGDIHGQFHDLLELFKISGNLPDTSYLFLGDYVDRGFKSVETISLLFCYKIRYPNRIYLTRGNHESRKVTQVYGFYDECFKKYDNFNIWKYFTDVFDTLPLAATIDNKVFCLHGGLSPEIKSLEEVSKINRAQEVPDTGLICDLLWSDPDEKEGWSMSPRGAGSLFGPDISKQFCHHNKLELILRAHQLVMDGYSWTHNDKICTLFSAPNYCNRCGNKASIMEMDDNYARVIQQYDQSNENQSEYLITKRTPNYFL
jgi:serine/threonine-protein phosphatase 2A catalytic subunit